MVEGLIFILRICLIILLWVFFWQVIEPVSKRARLLRAVLLVAGLLVTLVALRAFGA